MSLSNKEWTQVEIDNFKKYWKLMLEKEREFTEKCLAKFLENPFDVYKDKE